MPSWELVWPPLSINHIHRRTRGHVLIDERALSWRDLVIVTVRQSHLKAPPGRLILTLDLFPPNNAVRDGDNYLKWTQDSLCKALDIDDTWIKRWMIEMHDAERPGRIVVSLDTYQQGE